MTSGALALLPVHPPLDAPGSLLFDTARASHEEGRTLWFAEPDAAYLAHTPDEVAPALAQAFQAQAKGAYVAGLVTYEAGLALAGLPIVELPDVPLVALYAYARPAPVPALPLPGALPTTLRPGWSAHRYAEQHEAVRALIHEGDVYQVNLTFPMTGACSTPGSALYAALRARQPVPFGALLSLDAAQVVSVSPELFFRLDGRRLTTRPMKGTAPRGTTAPEDAALRAALALDPKNRAENLMIVDLLRNDLSEVCVPGSVAVPALFETEQHPTLTQMTSTVQGTLREACGLLDVFRALFPSGSITGAPKRRAMQRIAEREASPRGAYCGAIGYAAPDGTAVFSVAIRTITLMQGTATLGVGSGVTYDSVAADEYRECLLKAQFLQG